jgi:ribonuclease P/MRP protein subunit POP5
MKLNPSMREKRRYLVFEAIAKKPVPYEKAVDAFSKEAVSFIGTAAFAKSGFRQMPKMWSPELQRGMVRIQRKYVEPMRASLCLVRKIGRQNAIMRSVGISGMINKATEYLR